MASLLENRVAIVTGAGRGLGAATAQLLAGAGAATVLTARTEEQIDAVAGRIQQAGGEALAVPADISRPEAVKALVDRCMREFGRIDVLVNIAGTVAGLGKPTWEVRSEEWRALVDTNVTGPFLLCQTAVPVMLHQGSGRILMLTSTSAERPTRAAGPYGLSKAAVNQLVRTLALELDRTGVTVNAFNPGPAATATLDRVTQALWPGAAAARRRALDRTPEEAARMILWLCSTEMAHVTGEVFYWNDPDVVAALARFSRSAGIPAGTTKGW